MAISFNATASAGGNVTTLTPTLPAGLLGGDIIIAVWEYLNTATPITPPASGWTQLQAPQVAGTSSTYITWHAAAGILGATSTEAGTAPYSWVNGVANRQSVTLVAYTGVDNTTPIDAYAVLSESVSGTTHVTGATSTVTANSVPLSVIGERNSTTTTNWTSPTGYTERADFNTAGTGGTSISVADKAAVPAATGIGGDTWMSGAAGTGYTMWAIALRQAPTNVTGAVTGATTAAGTVSGAVGDVGAVTGNTVAGGSVAGAVGAVGAVSGATTAGGTVAASVGKVAAVTGATTAGGTVAGSVGKVASVTGATTAGGSVAGAAASGPASVVGVTIAGGVVEATVTRTVVSGGGWGELLGILDEVRSIARDESTRTPVACPNDGEPLLEGPHGGLYCPWGDYQFGAAAPASW